MTTQFRIKAGVRPYPLHVLDVTDRDDVFVKGFVVLPNGENAKGERTYYADEVEERPPLWLKVIDREGFLVGMVHARVGLETYNGPVTRWNDKGSFWTMGEYGEQTYRIGDHQPCVYKSKVKNIDVFVTAEAWRERLKEKVKA